MRVEVVFGDIDDRDGYVGAMVGGALDVGQYVGEDEAQLDGAVTFLQPLDVVRVTA